MPPRYLGPWSTFEGDDYGWTKLHHAVFTGDEKILVDELKSITENCPDSRRLITIYDLHRALQLAVFIGKAPIVQLLLEGGASVECVGPQPLWRPIPEMKLVYQNSIDWQRSSALHIAAREGHLEIIQLLLATGCPRESQNALCQTALHISTWYGHIDVTKLLLDSGMRFQADAQGWTPLHYACHNKCPELMHLFITYLFQTYEYNRHANNMHINSVFNFAVIEGYDDALKMLLSITAAVGLECSFQDWRRECRLGDALHYAVAYGDLDTMKILINAGIDPNWIRSEVTALHQAARMGYIEQATLLLDSGANIDARTSNAFTSTPLHWAASYGRVEMLKFLISRGANVYVVAGREELTTLDVALSTGYGDIYFIQRFLDGGPRRGDLESLLWSKYYQATEQDREQMARALVGAGVDVNTRHTANGFDVALKLPLHIAAEKNRPGAVELLLELGADPNIGTAYFQETPLHFASSAAVAAVLIQGGADVHEKTIEGKTPLHYLAEKWPGKKEGSRTLEVLMAAGGSLSEVDYHGNSALHAAVLKKGCTRPLVVALLEAGADGALRNNRGFTPFDSFIHHRLQISRHSSTKNLWKYMGHNDLLVAINLLPYSPHGWDDIPVGTGGLEDAIEIMWEHAPQDLSKLSAKLKTPYDFPELFMRMRRPMKEVIRTAMRGLYRWLPPGPAPPELRRQVLEMIFSKY